MMDCYIHVVWVRKMCLISSQTHIPLYKHGCFSMHDPSMLAERPILVSALESIQLLLILKKKLLVIGKSSFSLFSIDHHRGSKLTEKDNNGPHYRIGPDCEGGA